MKNPIKGYWMFDNHQVKTVKLGSLDLMLRQADELYDEDPHGSLFIFSSDKNAPGAVNYCIHAARKKDEFVKAAKEMLAQVEQIL